MINGADSSHDDKLKKRQTNCQGVELVVDTIYFYSKSKRYFEFSNFSPHGFEEEGVYWPTVEHYFQAQKFSVPDAIYFREMIRLAKSPHKAKALGRSDQMPLRSDWETVKEDIMQYALRRKFECPVLRRILISTGRRKLVEASRHDKYWGSDRDGSGQNRLGVLLMQLREELRRQ